MHLPPSWFVINNKKGGKFKRRQVAQSQEMTQKCDRFNRSIFGWQKNDHIVSLHHVPIAVLTKKYYVFNNLKADKSEMFRGNVNHKSALVQIATLV